MTKNIRVIGISLILVILQACSSLPAGLTGTPTTYPFVAETGGPVGFSATLSSPDIVQLTWEPVADATGYELQIVPNGLDPLTFAFLPPEAVSFEHLLAPESSLLTYRLQTITASGPGGASSLQITTLAHAPNPLTVQAQFSDDETTSAVIGLDGGTLETTDARGVTYSLVIPAGALETELEIKMTPLGAIEGWPLDGSFQGAVRLEPEGWLLDEIAYLTIRLPGGSASDLATVGFAFNGSGEEFHLAPVYKNTTALAGLGATGARQASRSWQQDGGGSSLPVTQLRSAGIGESSADAAAAMVTENAPTNTNDAADQKAAATEVEMDEMAPLLSKAELAEMATTNLLTQILNNVDDCSDFTRAVGSFHAWEAKVEGLGDTSGFRETIMEQLAEKAVETIEKSGQECIKAEKGVVPASIPCAEKLLRNIQSGSSLFYKELQNNITTNSALKDRMSAADDDTGKCPHSFGFNESVFSDARWISSCIPTLNRPYQVQWVALIYKGVYRLYPTDDENPYTGRVEGQSQAVAPGVSINIVYDGTYVINDTEKDAKGYPINMSVDLTYKMTITSCSEGKCVTTTENGTHGIPLSVRKTGCSVQGK